MFRRLNRRLAATASVVVIALAGLAPGLSTPAQAGTALPSVSGLASSPSGTTTEVIASSVPETRHAVSNVLAANDASRAWPAVDADLTPRLDAAVAAGGGNVLSNVLAFGIKITIHCEITFPPLKIKCTIDIQFTW